MKVNKTASSDASELPAAPAHAAAHDTRPQSAAQLRLQEWADGSEQATQLRQRAALMAGQGPVVQALRLKRSNDAVPGLHPGGEGIDIETADFQKFCAGVRQLIRANPEAIYVVHAELLAALDRESKEERKKHQEHLNFLGEIMDRQESSAAAAAAFEAELEQEKKAAELARAAKAKRELQSAQASIRGRNPNLPKGLWAKLFVLDKNPAADILMVLNLVCSQKSLDEWGGWLDLVLDGRYGRNLSVTALDSLLRSATISLAMAGRVVVDFAGFCSTERLNLLSQALGMRGPASNQVSANISDPALRTFIFQQDVTLVQLCSANLAPSRAYGSLIPLIVQETLTAAEVSLLELLSNVPLPVCRNCIAALRVLTISQATNLNLAAQAVIAGGQAVDDAAVTLMCPLIRNGVPGLALGSVIEYISGTVLYPNVAQADLFGILTHNGDLSGQMLRGFNPKLAGAPVLTWGMRNDLVGGGAGRNLYAPTNINGGWNLGFEIISDIFGWRGAGGHGCFTFAEIETARQNALGTIPPHQLFNVDRRLMVGGNWVTIVLNRGWSGIVTMYLS
jgi:hypothetical protein